MDMQAVTRAGAVHPAPQYPDSLRARLPTTSYDLPHVKSAIAEGS
jgi:hypothetical protein